MEIEPRAGTMRLRPTIVKAAGVPDEWSEVTADFTAPADTTGMMVMVRILAQPSGARIFVDDLNIFAYPETTPQKP